MRRNRAMSTGREPGGVRFTRESNTKDNEASRSDAVGEAQAASRNNNVDAVDMPLHSWEIGPMPCSLLSRFFRLCLPMFSDAVLGSGTKIPNYGCVYGTRLLHDAQQRVGKNPKSAQRQQGANGPGSLIARGTTCRLRKTRASAHVRLHQLKRNGAHEVRLGGRKTRSVVTARKTDTGTENFHPASTHLSFHWT